ncbi:cytochrome c oxidase subunit 4 [Seinonella peptonophila]|uniref:Cytochrome c oxidase subunit 4 n=1 Tax=Seinonella peptonophila TaxID=112248 RepID=A0A1M4ZIS6_9BACL|nr:cytochrome C oxidase subunit IV family protein [Seinonella peptonophila]SHF17934.1 cytochrome c oxidase subunit 4 [Seinonella peptonophila]
MANTTKKSGIGKHIISFAFMIALTIAAFYLVINNVVSKGWILPLILILAVIQVILQLFTFMHLDQKGSNYYTFFMIVGIFVAVISAIGIIVM